jgi:outer membrane protein OmpA-like peptidoglycan-associated protein
MLALACGACQASFSASGSVNSGAEANAQASAGAKPDDAAQRAAEAEAIRYRQGQLDYTGVINFEYNKADLQTDDVTQKTLTQFQDFLKQHEGVKIEIQGHTDSRGTDDYNRELSDRRAASVRKWLIDHGIAEDRITSVGKGEDAPRVVEPAACSDAVPDDPAPCEHAWGQNRRVVFRVTGGAETLPPEPAPAPAPEPAPAPAPVAEREECPWLFGFHVNGLGPNSWVTVAGAMQPGVCWLEPSLGVGLGFGDIDAKNPPAGTEIDSSYWSLSVPLRARIWFMNTHSLLGDVGVGFTHYRPSADLTDTGGVNGTWTRTSTPLIANAGLGYGFRPNGAQSGPRLGIVVGGLFHLTKLSNSELDQGAGFNAADAAALKTSLDQGSDELPKIEPYGEISFGMLY